MIASWREHRVAAAVGHRDPLRARRGRGRRGGDVRVRPPAGGPRAPHRVHQRAARGPGPAAIDAAVRARIAAGEDLYHLDRGRPRRPGRRPRGDPGPVCRVRRRRHRGDRGPGPPRLSRRGAHHRPARPGAGARLRRAGRRGDRAGGRGPRPGRRACGRGWTPSPTGCAAGPRPRTVVLEWTDPPFAPGHWVPEMVQHAGGECVLGRPGRAVGADDAGPTSPPPPRTSSSRHPAASGWRTRPGWPASCSRPGRCRRRPGLGGGRQRLLRPAGPAPGRRDRGARRDPARRPGAGPGWPGACAEDRRGGPARHGRGRRRDRRRRALWRRAGLAGRRPAARDDDGRQRRRLRTHRRADGAARRDAAGPRLLRPFVGTGVLGGFTTFSTYAVDLQRLLAGGHAWTAVAYLVATPRRRTDGGVGLGPGTRRLLGGRR